MWNARLNETQAGIREAFVLISFFTNKLKLEKVKCSTQGHQRAWDFCRYFRSISTGPLHPCAVYRISDYWSHHVNIHFHICFKCVNLQAWRQPNSQLGRKGRTMVHMGLLGRHGVTWAGNNQGDHSETALEEPFRSPSISDHKSTCLMADFCWLEWYF